MPNSIRQDISKRRKATTLPPKLSGRIANKLALLRDRYGIHFDPTVLSLASNPSLAFQEGAPTSIARFFGRHIDIWLEEKEEPELIFSPADNAWVPAARRDYNIAIFNMSSGRAESWCRLRSDSSWRHDHWKSCGGKKKSRFSGDLNYIKSLEFLAYNKGIGMLKRDNELWMYLKFIEPIGWSADGKELSAICVQCARVRRARDSKAKKQSSKHGYMVRLHGYPVSASDITLAFSGKKIKASDVPVFNNKAS